MASVVIHNVGGVHAKQGMMLSIEKGKIYVRTLGFRVLCDMTVFFSG